MNTIALIVPNNLWVCPYVSIYTKIFEKMGAKYEVISWNRAGKEERGIQYNKMEKSRNHIEVLWSYYKFARFVKKTLEKEDYKKVVVFSPQLAIFLSGYLRKRYKNLYIIDYRDLSIEQKAPLGLIFKKCLEYSYANVISSPGFRDYLPPNFKYDISHNFRVEETFSEARARIPDIQKDIRILTIGALRTDCNREVMDALGNRDRFQLDFVGKGMAAKTLEEYARLHSYDNINFTGYYEKQDEPDIIKGCTMINIVYPLIPSHISALSNRFYNSLKYKRPMIVTKHTIQGDFAEKYRVGLVIENCEHLEDKIRNYLQQLDFEEYVKRCDELLDVFVEENFLFEKMLKKFIKAN